MKSLTQQPFSEIVGAGTRFAKAGTHLSVDLVKRALEVMPFATRGEEIIDIPEAAQPSDIDIWRRISVT
jgi:hypothetical protein